LPRIFSFPFPEAACEPHRLPSLSFFFFPFRNSLSCVSRSCIDGAGSLWVSQDNHLDFFYRSFSCPPLSGKRPEYHSFLSFFFPRSSEEIAPLFTEYSLFSAPPKEDDTFEPPLPILRVMSQKAGFHHYLCSSHWPTVSPFFYPPPLSSLRGRPPNFSLGQGLHFRTPGGSFPPRSGTAMRAASSFFPLLSRAFFRLLPGIELGSAAACSFFLSLSRRNRKTSDALFFRIIPHLCILTRSSRAGSDCRPSSSLMRD